MFDYARSDTHFLLYIYDNLRNALLDKSDTFPDGNLIEVVMERSKEEALQRYERPFYDIERGSGPMGWYSMLSRTPALFNREQFAVFRALHQWRDQVAREEDESVHVVMPKHVLCKLAREMPVDTSSLLASSHPISNSFKTRKSQILATITKARNLGHKGPDMKETMQAMQPVTDDRFSQYHGPEQVVQALAVEKMAVPPQLQHCLRRLPALNRYSRFWGSTILGSMDRGPIVQVPREYFCLALPMPRLNAEIFQDTKAADANAYGRRRTSPGARAEYQYLRPKATEVFIVKEAGSPRKRKAIDLHDPLEAVYSSPETSAVDHAQEHADEFDKPLHFKYQEQKDQFTRVSSEIKEERPAQRHERKRLKKEAHRVNEDVKSQRPREVEPFDYAFAPSVLHAQKDSNRMIADKEINPYSKSSNAPEGARKAKKEQEGRSFTFRS